MNQLTKSHNPRRHHLSTALLGALLPLGLISIATAIAWSWRGDLPDPVATN